MGNKLAYTLFCLAIVFGSIVQAQTGTIQGIITDAELGSSLPGATVLVEGTNIGTVTDVDGAFTLTGIPLGPQQIQLSFLGFETKVLEIDIPEGDPIVIEESLGAAPILGTEVVVTGQLLGQAKAINQQLNSDMIACLLYTSPSPRDS